MGRRGWIVGGGAALLVGGVVLLWPRRGVAGGSGGSNSSGSGGSGSSAVVSTGRSGKATERLAQYVPAIVRLSDEADVSPLLTAAHVLQESLGKASAIRVEVAGTLESALRKQLQADANADPAEFLDALDAGRLAGQARTASVGLLQILPETARGVGFKGASRDLLIPEVNLTFGIRYIKKNLDRYGRDPLDEIAAYNAGSVKLAAPTLARRLIEAARTIGISPCAIVSGSSNSKVQGIISAQGGYFVLANSASGASSLKQSGKTTYCNQEYVDGVTKWADAALLDYPMLGASGTYLSGLDGGYPGPVSDIDIVFRA